MGVAGGHARPPHPALPACLLALVVLAGLWTVATRAPRASGVASAALPQHPCGDAVGTAAAHRGALEAVLQPMAFLQELAKQPSRTWLQIGANTMDSLNSRNDPLKTILATIPSWRKVFVEPIPQLFAQLQESIKQWPNSSALDVAISLRGDVAEGIAQMWCLEEGFNATRLGVDLPFWANQICSFAANHIPKHFPGRQGVPVNVTALSLEELLRRTNFTSVEVLLIDTEGFDYSVLQQIPFHRLRPAFILWEHKHLGANIGPAMELVRRHGYLVKVLDAENTVGIAL